MCFNTDRNHHGNFQTVHFGSGPMYTSRSQCYSKNLHGLPPILFSIGVDLMYFQNYTGCAYA